MNPVPVLTLDGPGGVGKGTVGRILATRLGWHYLDSGALYRIVALAALRAGLDEHQVISIVRLIPHLDVTFEGQVIHLGDEDVTTAIRGATVSELASALAVYPEIRAALNGRQQGMRRMPGLVADGRDMGTVVFPDAQYKVFLVASPEERARRRYKQLKQQGINANLTQLSDELRKRDARDAGRRVAPLRPAAEAIVIDTSDRTPGQVADRVLGLMLGSSRK